MNGHFPAQPFGFSPFLGLHGVKNRSWYSYYVAIFALFSLKTGPNAHDILDFRQSTEEFASVFSDISALIERIKLI